MELCHHCSERTRGAYPRERLGYSTCIIMHFYFINATCNIIHINMYMYIALILSHVKYMYVYM